MTELANEELWKTIFAVGHPQLKSYQRVHRTLPPWQLPRDECRMCFAPFTGIGGFLMRRARGVGRSITNEFWCSRCNSFIRQFPGGAEVELSMFFVDIRGSVSIAERLRPADFSRLMSSFYATATKTLMEDDGFILDLVGDEVMACFPPGFVGEWHARKAIKAAEDLLKAKPSSPDEESMPFGIGVHTGTVYMGTISGSEGGIQDVRAMGDNVNVAARLAQMAGPSEALVSEAALKAANLSCSGLESRQLTLKGRNEPIAARVIHHDSLMLSAENLAA